MNLALSGRLFETPAGYALDLEAFLKFARACGYDGVEIRYPQLPLETPSARLDETAALLKTLGLAWSFGAVEGIVGEPPSNEPCACWRCIGGAAAGSRASPFRGPTTSPGRNGSPTRRRAEGCGSLRSFTTAR